MRRPVGHAPTGSGGPTTSRPYRGAASLWSADVRRAEERDYMRAVRAADSAPGKIRAYAAGLGGVMPEVAPLLDALGRAGESGPGGWEVPTSSGRRMHRSTICCWCPEDGTSVATRRCPSTCGRRCCWSGETRRRALPGDLRLDYLRMAVHAFFMTSLQIRNMPDDVHRTLKSRAAGRGQSLSEYATEMLRRSAEVPTLAELTERIRVRGSAGPQSADPVVEVLRAERGAR